MLEQVILLIKRLIAKRFTGRLIIDFVNGSASKKIYVRTAENIEKFEV